MIHGEADIMTRPAGGIATAEAIAGATYHSIPDMGQDLPRPLWPELVAS